MLVQGVIDLAKNGELSNLSVKEDTQAVLGYINLGLIELYKRFVLEVKEYIIELQDNKEIYDMPADFMWVIAAYGEVDETSTETVNVLPVNVEDNPLSINTVSWNKIQVPLSIPGSFISIIYASSPPTLTTNNISEPIPLPVQLVEALLHYVGYRAHMSMDGNIQAENNTHYQRFELACKRAKLDGVLTADDVDMSARLRLRGFV